MSGHSPLLRNILFRLLIMYIVSAVGSKPVMACELGCDGLFNKFDKPFVKEVRSERMTGFFICVKDFISI